MKSHLLTKILPHVHTPLVLILCAMAEETKHIFHELHQREFVESLSHSGRLVHNNVCVEVRTTGIGMSRSAANTSLWIERLRPDIIMNTGTAGAHNEELNLGDVVVGETLVNIASTIRGNTKVHHYGDRDTGTHVWHSDSALVWLASRPYSLLQPWPNVKSKEETRPMLLHVGRVASSDIWNDSPASVVETRSVFETDCEDMEAASIAVVAHEHDIPFIVVKDISNSVFRTSQQQKKDAFDATQHDIPPMGGRNSAIVAADTCLYLSTIMTA